MNNLTPEYQRAFDLRWRHAKELSDWFEGKADRHPHGTSAHNQILPQVLSKNCWDTAPRAWQFSEQGNAMGMTP